MRVKTLTAVILLSSATYAFAGGGAPVPEGTMDNNPSGRPGKVLSEAECQKAWEMAGPDGDTLSEEKAVPFVLNFQMVDSSKDAEVSAEEWKEGCSKGWVSADAQTTKDMEGTTSDSDEMEGAASDSDKMETKDAPAESDKKDM
jgi:hypothetical protein